MRAASSALRCRTQRSLSSVAASDRFGIPRARHRARGHGGLEGGDLPRRIEGDVEARPALRELSARARAQGRDDRHVLRRALRADPRDGELRRRDAPIAAARRASASTRRWFFATFRRRSAADGHGCRPCPPAGPSASRATTRRTPSSRCRARRAPGRSPLRRAAHQRVFDLQVEIGCTAAARGSSRPRLPTTDVPDVAGLLDSAIAPMVSSIGTSGSRRAGRRCRRGRRPGARGCRRGSSWSPPGWYPSRRSCRSDRAAPPNFTVNSALSRRPARPADEQLVVPHPVEVAGVEHVDAALEGRVDGGDALRLVAVAVQARRSMPMQPRAMGNTSGPVIPSFFFRCFFSSSRHASGLHLIRTSE